MKKIALTIQLRTIIASVLTVSLIAVPLHLPSACAASAAIEVKTESEYRSEAASFTRALSAVAAIATMKLETGDDLKKAIAILDRERPNLKLHRSKYIATVLSDAIFTSAVKRRAPDQTSAEALLKEIQADPKAVLRLDGAESLKGRIQRSIEADAATLRRVAERLKETAERIKKANQAASSGFHSAPELKLLQARFATESQPLNSVSTVSFPQVELVVFLIVATGVACFLIGYISGRLTNYLDLRDDIEECQASADDVYTRCLAGANNLPSGFPFFQRETATALCYAEWLGRQALCMVAG